MATCPSSRRRGVILIIAVVCIAVASVMFMAIVRTAFAERSALEVYRASGIPMSQWQAQQSDWLPAQDYRVCQMAICPADRAELHRRIALRFDIMMAEGFLEEVRDLWQRGDQQARQTHQQKHESKSE